MSEASSGASIGILVLGAGASVRMGSPKQLLPYRGRGLLRHSAEFALASPCRPVCIVLGAHADRLRREVQGLPVLVALNPGWEAGIGSSIRVGLEAVLTASGDVQGVVITLCDQPYVTDRAINRLVEAHRTSGQPIVASRYGGAAGVPALFGRRFFPQLLSLDGSEGAKRLMARNASVVECVAMPEALVDVDTPRDYAALTASEGESKRATHRPPSPNPKFLTAKAP